MKKNKMKITGWVLTLLPALLFIFSAAMKFMQGPEVVEGMAKFGFPLEMIVPLAILELICALIYLIPKTTVLGAILLTGYLGGALLTHLRIGESIVIHIVLGVALWGGIYLRDARLRESIPFRR